MSGGGAGMYATNTSSGNVLLRSETSAKPLINKRIEFSDFSNVS